MKKTLYSENAPAPVGPYSQGIKAGNFIFISGQLPIDPSSNKMIEGSIEEKTHQCLKNIKAILSSEGLNFSHIVKVTIYTTDISQFSKINKVYGEYFKEDPPARAVVEVSKLPLDSDIEIEAIAYADGE